MMELVGLVQRMSESRGVKKIIQGILVGNKKTRKIVDA